MTARANGGDCSTARGRPRAARCAATPPVDSASSACSRVTNRPVRAVASRPSARRTALVDEHADPRPGPERLASSRGELQAVLTALQALPEADRAAILLRAEEGLSYDEIGALLGLAPIAARVKVHRARTKLNRAVGAAAWWLTAAVLWGWHVRVRRRLAVSGV